MRGWVYSRRVESPDALSLWNELGLTSEGCWWFGWHESQLYLPQPLTTLPNEPWEHLRLFSPQAELRLQRIGTQYEAVLLEESESHQRPDWNLIGEFEVEEAKRVLIGERGAQTDDYTLAEIAYPRFFQYGIRVDWGERVIALVRHYLEPTTRRLCYTRYMQIETGKPENLILEVK